MGRIADRFSHILVAGGAGFIGSHIADRLLEQDMEVTVLDNLYSGRLENILHNENKKRFHFIHGDIRDYDFVKRTVKGVDAVFNEAAVVGVPRSVEQPMLANDVNVGGTLTLLKACLEADVERFIQASSASVYGNAMILPIDENSPLSPVSPYAVAELAAENYARVFCNTYGLKTVCLRYFNVYGPRQAFSVYSGVIPIFVNQLSHDQCPTIFGDGKQTRDFVYVEDVVDACMLTLTSKKTTGQVFNVATGVPLSVNELVETLQKIMIKRHLKPVHKRLRPGDVRFSYANIEKARKILKYEPKFNLQEGLTKLVDWSSKQKC
jgi:nucleoside-diphosphate-sugar epimerase